MGVLILNKYSTIIEGSLEQFWKNAFDKEIEYLIMLADDSNRTRLFKKVSERHRFSPMQEIEAENGVLFGVIGDQAREVRQRIFGEVNTLMMLDAKMPAETALEIACVRALRSAIEDGDNLLVGGSIQAAVMKGREGYYMSVSYRGKFFFRGVEFGPVLRSDDAPLKHALWPYGDVKYDPSRNLETVAADH